MWIICWDQYPISWSKSRWDNWVHWRWQENEGCARN